MQAKVEVRLDLSYRTLERETFNAKTSEQAHHVTNAQVKSAAPASIFRPAFRKVQPIGMLLLEKTPTPF